MKAIQIREFGNSEVLQYVDLPKPSIKENQLLIKVSVARINFADIMVRRGFYPMLPALPAVLGRYSGRDGQRCK